MIDHPLSGQFGEEIDKFRTVLAGLGVGADDKVALISNNRVEWAVTYYAANGLGAQIVPLYEAQTEADWRYIVEHSDAKVLVVATVSIFEVTHKYIDDFDKLKTVICFDADSHRPFSYRHLMSMVDSKALVSAWNPPPEHLSAIVYTSGSTGNPKGVKLSHSNFVANLLGIAKTFGEELVREASSKQSVCYLPWSHIFGLTCSLHTSLGSGIVLVWIYICVYVSVISL